MLTRILIILLLLNVNAFSQKRIPVKVGVGLSAPDIKYNLDISVKLISDKELKTLDGTIKSVKGTDFISEVSFSDSKINLEVKAENETEKYGFDLSGEEDSIRIFVILDFFGENLRFQGIYISKYYDGNHLVNLIPDWDFKQGSIPRYKIVNVTPGKSFFGTGGGNLFWSEFFTYKHGFWLKEYISFVCGSNGRNPPINFNDTTIANIPGYLPLKVNRDSILLYPISGKYKFRTSFTESDYLPIKDPITEVYKYSSVVYTTETHFEIK